MTDPVQGDFSNFVIARNGGMSVELTPQHFDVELPPIERRPDGSIPGWLPFVRGEKPETN